MNIFPPVNKESMTQRYNGTNSNYYTPDTITVYDSKIQFKQIIHTKLNHYSSAEELFSSQLPPSTYIFNESINLHMPVSSCRLLPNMSISISFDRTRYDYMMYRIMSELDKLNIIDFNKISTGQGVPDHLYVQEIKHFGTLQIDLLSGVIFYSKDESALIQLANVLPMRLQDPLPSQRLSSGSVPCYFVLLNDNNEALLLNIKGKITNSQPWTNDVPIITTNKRNRYEISEEQQQDQTGEENEENTNKQENKEYVYY
jgi:hypothetical protein